MAFLHSGRLHYLYHLLKPMYFVDRRPFFPTFHTGRSHDTKTAKLMLFTVLPEAGCSGFGEALKPSYFRLGQGCYLIRGTCRDC